MSDEIWKDVVGFPGYEVSSHGQIYMKLDDKFLPERIKASWQRNSAFAKHK